MYTTYILNHRNVTGSVSLSRMPSVSNRTKFIQNSIEPNRTSLIIEQNILLWVRLSKTNRIIRRKSNDWCSIGFDYRTFDWIPGYVVVQFYPWFKFCFPLFLGMVVYDNEFKTKKNKIRTKDKIEPQQIRRVNVTTKIGSTLATVLNENSKSRDI